MKQFWLVLLFCSAPLFAQNLFGGGEGNPDLHTNQESLRKWQEKRFGMFIHWGPIALRGTEIGWSRGREVASAEYDQLYKEFNPVLFNADEWVQTAKAAGMKYIILVTKHHDGFALWDSDYSDYDIFTGPFKRDIVHEISTACKKFDILFGTYYSILDWRHPDYPIELQNGEQIEKARADMSKYLPEMKGQIQELIEKYDTKILWFDGEWEEPWTHDMGMELYAWARSLNDELLINNRVDKGREGMLGFSKGAQFAGDFETPEQRVGTFNIETAWESCITIGEQWSWKPNDVMKSARDCIRLLLQTVGGDGNLLLNVSPMLDGRLEQRQIDVLLQIGEWLDVYGETVYGTRGGPTPPQHWGVTTQKSDRVYVHVLEQQDSEILLPEFNRTIKFAALFADGRPVSFRFSAEGLILSLPKLPGDLIDVVVELKL